jgi:hypothetical protein
MIRSRSGNLFFVSLKRGLPGWVGAGTWPLPRAFFLVLRTLGDPRNSFLGDPRDPFLVLRTLGDPRDFCLGDPRGPRDSF